MHILDHIGVNVSDYPRSKAFYQEALAPLGISLVMEFGSAAGFGRGGKPEFWIGHGATSYQTAEQLARITPVHVCFTASRAEVDAFHRAALAAGGRDFGGPGLRPYHPSYYGAFVLDPDGHNVEAVCHARSGERQAATRPTAKSAAAKRATAKRTATKKPAKATAKRLAARNPAKKAPARAKRAAKKRR